MNTRCLSKVVFSLLAVLAGMACAESDCLSSRADWAARVSALLQASVLQPYEKLEVQPLRELPAISNAELTVQTPWPAGRVAIAVAGRDCLSGALLRQVVWFRAQAYRHAWVYGREAKAESRLIDAAPEKLLLDLAALHLSDAELLSSPGEEVLVHSVSAGAPVRRQDVKAAPLVSRNAEVTVVVQGKGLVIRTRGTAMQFGAEGEWIPVMVTGAVKTTRARVIAPGVVHVDI